ncbi:hypothetical protein AWC03_09815 [Mycobacterium europaeum]|uniref:helix-turn-helix domain-containing protein n=1 Tax=Mycobacterium europaeum TaxID=761804 RepID=UPI000A14C595|nr:helix-turn-helix domain-containing protein [Mycobacterium europaeum]ORV61486.1 hypothetical protein AWC03_09815 [Mycobacterium europaeum]
MADDDIRARYPGIFAAVRLNTIPIDLDLVRYIVHWLGDYARLKQQPGQSGVPEGVLAAQRALAEAYAAISDSRRREADRPMATEFLISGHDARVGTDEAAAELGVSADTVRWHYRKGNLDGRKVGRQLMVTVASIETLKARLNEQRGA